VDTIHFELHRAEISERRVPALGIIEALDVIENVWSTGARWRVDLDQFWSLKSKAKLSMNMLSSANALEFHIEFALCPAQSIGID
jgi:hypothetical protein